MIKGWNAAQYRASVLAGMLAIAAGGCRSSSLWDTTNPNNQVTAAALNSPTGAQQAFIAAKWQVVNALIGYNSPNGLVLSSELLSDEFTETYTGWFSSVDGRYSSLAEGRFVDERNGNAALSELLAARSALLLTVPSLAKYEVGQNRALAGEAEALAGYAEVLMAEDYCAGIPLDQADYGGGVTFGTLLTTDSMLGTAETHFRQVLANTDNSDTVTYLASIGLGRTLLDRDRFDSAAAAVTNVPLGFAYNMYGQNGYNNSGAFVNFFYGYYQDGGAGQYYEGPMVANDEGNTTNNFAVAIDSRLALVSQGYTDDGSINQCCGTHFADSVFLWPVKFGNTPTPSSAFPLATGVEARLIAAEDTFSRGHYANLYPYLDSLRVQASATYLAAASPVPSLSGDTAGTCGGVDDTLCIKTLFRERAFWLFGLGNRLGDMRREIRQYHLDATTVYPTGPYWHDPADSAIERTAFGGNYAGPNWSVYGSDVSLSLPTAAFSVNPNFKGGCLAGTSPATP